MRHLLPLSLLLPACRPSAPDDRDSPDYSAPDDTGDEGWRLVALEEAEGPAGLGLGRGVAVADYDGDGVLDALFSTTTPSTSTGSTVSAWRGLDGERFEDATAAWGLERTESTWGTLPFDLDEDGDLDLLATRDGWYGPLPNNLEIWGDEGFASSALPTPACGDGASMGAAAADFDLDGDLDVIVGDGSPSAKGGCVEVLFHEERSLVPSGEVGAGALDSFGATAADLDGDLYPEIVVVGFYGATVYHNLGESPWFNLDDPDETVTLPQSGAEFAMTPTLLDYDQDGDLDVFICTWADPTVDPDVAFPALYRNDGDLQFTEVAGEVGALAGRGCMGVGSGDLDGNGYPEVLLGTGGPDEGNDVTDALLLNMGGSFFDATVALGLDGHTRLHGIAFADLNQDGANDLVLNPGGKYEGQEEAPRVLLNRGPAYPSLRVALEGTAANPWASGARVTVTTDLGPRYAWARHGDGFSSSTLLPVFVGLGLATEIRAVEVRFPDGAIVSTGALPLDAGLITVSHP